VWLNKRIYLTTVINAGMDLESLP